MARSYPSFLRKKICKPQWEIAVADKRIIRADRVVRNYKTAFNNVNKVGLSVSCEHVKKVLHLKRIVKLAAVARYVVAVELKSDIAVLFKSASF